MIEHIYQIGNFSLYGYSVQLVEIQYKNSSPVFKVWGRIPDNPNISQEFEYWDTAEEFFFKSVAKVTGGEFGRECPYQLEKGI